MTMGDDSAGALLAERGATSSSGSEAEESEYSDSSDEEDEFFMDPEGRVPFAGEVSFDFRSAPSALTSALSEPAVLARLVQDCQTVFSARAKTLEYSTGETFWTQADADPRNCLERLALDIFEAHTGGARFNRAKSGAEWWTQVIEDSDDIGWHWDKDYGMEAQGINVHPCLATVTYLSTNGGPTVILEKKGPMECENVRSVSGEAAKAWISRPSLGKHICFDGRYLHAAPADLALPPSVMTPPPVSVARKDEKDEINDGENGGTQKRDKDGELKVVAGEAAATPVAEDVPATVVGRQNETPAVAGATDEDNNGNPRDPVSNGANGGGSGSSGSSGSSGDSISTSTTKKRVTFLVNVWLNHAPKTAAALPEATAVKLGTSPLAARLTPEDFVPLRVLRLVSEGDAAAEGSAAVSGDDGGRREEGVGTGPEGSGECTAVATAVDMRWEFGEVGDQPGRHLRHEVLVPVPASFLPPPAADAPAAVSGVPSAGQCKASKDGAAVAVTASTGVAVGVGADGSSIGRDGGGGGSFCVEYPSAGRRPRVSRMGDDPDQEESESSSSSGEEDEEEEEQEEGKEGGGGER